MIPKILEYEDGRIRVTENAYVISEIKAILDKHDMNADPYLCYVHLMSAVDSPYINYEREERTECVIYDVINTIGDFDTEDELLEPAIERLKKAYTTPVRAFFEELQQELHRFRIYLRDTPIVDGGDGNLALRQRFMEKVGTTLANYKKAEQQADEELKLSTRGDQEVGMY